MKGWLVVNAFLESYKFKDIYELLLLSAKAHNIEIQMLTTAQVSGVVGEAFAENELPDFALFWDKDVLLARQLESKGVRLFNCADAVEACDNKALTAIKLSEAGVRTPRTIIAPKTFEGVGYTDLSFLDRAIEKLGLPVVIKESYGSFGMQVYLARNKDEAVEIVKKLGHKEFIMQEFVATSRGRDLRVNVVGDKAVAAIYRYNDEDFRSNLTIGGKMRAFDISEEQAEEALKACRALKLDFAGVDVMFGEDDEPVICEVNSNTHFRTTLDCTGVNLADLIMEHIAKEMIK